MGEVGCKVLFGLSLLNYHFVFTEIYFTLAHIFLHKPFYPSLPNDMCHCVTHNATLMCWSYQNVILSKLALFLQFILIKPVLHKVPSWLQFPMKCLLILCNQRWPSTFTTICLCKDLSTLPKKNRQRKKETLPQRSMYETIPFSDKAHNHVW